tara:strand:+ start:56 stop:427 length:372 start_codon:yes stop_codon:yes gene_type:complete
MLKTIENKLESFVRAELAGVHRVEITHGTMYLVLDKPGDCDFIHKEIRKFYKENINPEGGVNMYAVGEEFAFDFVPEDREAPVFTEEDETGVWSEFAEEGLQDEIEAQAEVLMDLEADAKEGR